MKKILFVFGILLVSLTSFAQNWYLMVYTQDSSSNFIPYINGHSYSLLPMDTFFIKLDTNEFVLGLAFEHEDVADIEQEVFIPYTDTIKIFEIVPKPKLYAAVNKSVLKLRYFNDEERRDEIDRLQDKYMLKDITVNQKIREALRTLPMKLQSQFEKD